MPAKPKTIDDYLARVSATQRAALEKLRRDIKAAAPAAEECISYDIPSYRLGSEAAGLVRRCEEPLRLLSRCSPHQGTRERACRI